MREGQQSTQFKFINYNMYLFLRLRNTGAGRLMNYRIVVPAIALAIGISIAAGALFYPQINEGTPNACGAFQVRMAIATLDADATLRENADLRVEAIKALSDGERSSTLVKRKHPNLPPSMGCAVEYYRLAANPTPVTENESKEENPAQASPSRTANGPIVSALNGKSDQLASYVGVDQCEAANQLNKLEILRLSFVKLFGEEGWSAWKDWSGNCGDPIAGVTDSELGKLVILQRMQPHAAMMNAAIISTLDGDVVAACMTTDDGKSAQWRGFGWAGVRSGEACYGGMGSNDTSPLGLVRTMTQAKSEAGG
jgi:hypothetical protein